MQIPNADNGGALGASMLDEIRRTAEHRLQQIEPLIEEAEQLRGVLDAIAKRPAAREPKSRSSENAAPRAKKGANKQVILDLVDSQPGITPAEISNLTGMKRTVAASTVSRLKRYGYLQEHEQGGVRLGRAARGEHAGSAGSMARAS